MSLESILTEHTNRCANTSQLPQQTRQQAIDVGNIIVYVGSSAHLRRILLQTMKVHNDSILLVNEAFNAGCYVTVCNALDRRLFIHSADMFNYLLIDDLVSKIDEVAVEMSIN